VDESAYKRLVAARDPRLDPTSRGGYFPLYRARSQPGEVTKELGSPETPENVSMANGSHGEEALEVAAERVGARD
jgi:hypothetical protein